MKNLKWYYSDDSEKNEHHSKKAIRDYGWINYDSSRNIYRKRYIKKDVECKILSDTNDDYRKITYSSYDLLKMDLNTNPSYYETFEVMHRAVPLLMPIHYEKEVNEKTVSSPGYLNKRAEFIDVIVYILVKYVSLFGTFERIKVCKNCDKLFLEKKYSYGVYCSNNCRVNYNVAAEKKEVYQCRNRQNRWLGRELSEPNTVKKSDCKACRKKKSAVKSGQCPVAVNKNEEELEQRIKSSRRTINNTTLLFIINNIL